MMRTFAAVIFAFAYVALFLAGTMVLALLVRIGEIILRWTRFA